MKVGDKIEFCYLDSFRVGQIVDIITHFSEKEKKIIEAFVYLKDDNGGITPYSLDGMEDIDILKKIYDSNGKELEPGDFVRFYPPHKRDTYYGGEITYGCNGDYSVRTICPKSKEDEVYPIDKCKTVLISKHND